MEQRSIEEEVQISFEKIVGVKLIGRRQTYDLEMSEKRRNYVAQDMVVHNSHASSYALIAYATAWLKYYYPNEFMTALLSFNSGDDDKLSTYIKESKRLGLKLIKPDVNKSSSNFILKGVNIVYPFNVIKKLGEKAIGVILKERKKGRFKSFEDFCERTKSTSVNVGVITNMIFAGCFRRFGDMNVIYEKFTKYDKRKDTVTALYCNDCRYKYPVILTKKKMETSGVVCPECGSVNVITEYSLIKNKKFNLNYCKNIVYGFAVDDIMKPYLGDIISKNAVLVRDLVDCVGEEVRAAGFISKIKKHVDKNGNEMAFLTLSDGQASVDIVVFASLWGTCENDIKKNSAYIMTGRYDESIILKRNGLIKLILKKNA